MTALQKALNGVSIYLRDLVVPQTAHLRQYNDQKIYTPKTFSSHNQMEDLCNLSIKLCPNSCQKVCQTTLNGLLNFHSQINSN